jgi:DNA-binding MarR family transcriptional regulator
MLSEHPLVRLLIDTERGRKFHAGIPYYIAYHEVGHETLEWATGTGLVERYHDEGDNENYPGTVIRLTSAGRELLECIRAKEQMAALGTLWSIQRTASTLHVVGTTYDDAAGRREPSHHAKDLPALADALLAQQADADADAAEAARKQVEVLRRHEDHTVRHEDPATLLAQQAGHASATVIRVVHEDEEGSMWVLMEGTFPGEGECSCTHRGLTFCGAGREVIGPTDDHEFWLKIFDFDADGVDEAFRPGDRVTLVPYRQQAEGEKGDER